MGLRSGDGVMDGDGVTQATTLLKKLADKYGTPAEKGAATKAIIAVINDRDEWDQDWPEIGHVAYGETDCTCVGCSR